MADLGKSCMMCVHFDIYLGSPGYSVDTPGSVGRVKCNRDAQPSADEEDIRNAETFRAWVRFGNACPKFEPARDE